MRQASTLVVEVQNDEAARSEMDNMKNSNHQSRPERNKTGRLRPPSKYYAEPSAKRSKGNSEKRQDNKDW